MNKNLARDLAIFSGLFVVAFLAKMEAINFLLALPIGVVVIIYAYKYQAKVYKRWMENDDQSSSWFLTFTTGLVMDLYVWPVYFFLPVAAGFLSGYLVFSVLNALFISP